ncbi:hypothetical protein [Metabacillus malikii]|uniref:t-SNARE complex subunit (Syntaxin) n=1 Tax=Metabacillus malikii TaxID=1504265 RepID=A0ABT9ZFK1_9BACI|nr:hypothetical protein [Metabacillus malikii]MDQ0231038.1 t-SNARE complex subunit (syntaxin) [Metabacillus malikii]
MENFFQYDSRLMIKLPKPNIPWESLNHQTKEQIMAKWESIRGNIPDRIAEIEKQIEQKQEELNNEDNFDYSCQLTEEIANLASKINDLWLWFRSE